MAIVKEGQLVEAKQELWKSIQILEELVKALKKDLKATEISQVEVKEERSKEVKKERGRRQKKKELALHTEELLKSMLCFIAVVNGRYSTEAEQKMSGPGSREGPEGGERGGEDRGGGIEDKAR